MLFEKSGAEASIISASDVQAGFVFDENELCDGHKTAVRIVHGKYTDESGAGHEEAFISKPFVVTLAALAFPKVIKSIGLRWVDNTEQPDERSVEATALIGFVDSKGESRTQLFTCPGKSVNKEHLSERSEFFYEVWCLDKLREQLNVFGVYTANTVLDKLTSTDSAKIVEMIKSEVPK